MTTKKDSVSSQVSLATSGQYHPFGPLKSFTFGNGLVFTKTLTQDYLIDTLKAQDTGTSTTVLDRGHSFGDDINLTGITDNVTPARSETYAYTPANRLQTAGGIWGSLAYGYDSVGNRTSEALTSGITTTWTYAYSPTNNKLSTVTEGANVRTLTHDGAGNISADDRVGTVYNYRYNNRGRLDRLTIGATVTADYVYDGLERLAIRTTQNMSPAGTTHYVYDLGGRLIAEADDNGQTLREYVWLDDMPLAVMADVDTTSPQLWFVHADHLDRPVRMTDGSQAVVWDSVYRPFGQSVSITGSASNNLRFPGQYFLLESGLHYNWHRHYDPTTGRYLQPDPLGFVDGPSLYAYVNSRPTIERDRNGLQSAPLPHPGYTPIPPVYWPGTPENKRWTDQFIEGMQGLWDFAQRLCRQSTSGSGGDGGKDPDCGEEIRRAREICVEAYANRWRSNYNVGPYRKPTGGPWTIQDCMRGLVSERCGGNPT